MEPRARKYIKGYGFLSLASKYKKQLLDTWLDSFKTASEKVVPKAGEFIRNKIANDDKIEKQEPVEEIIISLEKRDKILN